MNQRIASAADYHRVKKSYRLDAPKYFNFAFDVVDQWAKQHGGQPALRWIGPSDEQRVVTYAQLAARSNRLANALVDLGLSPGDRVLVILPRVIPWWETMVGLFKARMVALPGTTLLTSSDIAYRIRAADAAAIITDSSGAQSVERVAEKLPSLKVRVLVDDAPRDGWQLYEQMIGDASDELATSRTSSDEPAMVYFTSGTTGLPKMVVHTHASYGIGHQITGQFWLDLRPNDLHWNISDTGWAKAAWSSLFGPWQCGTCLLVQHNQAKFDPGDVLTMLAKYPITTMCAAPTIYRMLIQQDLSRFQPLALRDCVAAGEPLNPEAISIWKKATGITVRDGYGQTETVLLCGNFPGVEVKPGSMGLPAPGIDLAVIDEHGQRQPPGQEGDIAVCVAPVRPVGLFREYYRNPEATAASHRGSWYVTGDRGLVDRDGYFWFVGRADDVITSSAYRIGPFEVESALLEHPAVAEAAVVGKPDSMRGEIVKSFIVLAAGYTPSDQLIAELQSHVKQVTAPYKYPREIQFLDQLPKTISGKIRRIQLRDSCK